MWEARMFERIIKVFAFFAFGIVMYLVCKYSISYMFTAFNASGQDPADWGLAYWIFGLIPFCVVGHYLLKAWLAVKGHNAGEFKESGIPRRKPPVQQYPIDRTQPW